MADTTCPRCGAGLTSDGTADGLCPACLLEEGFIGSSLDESGDPDWGTFSSGSHIGPFQIIKMRGRGGMATVYEAHDTRLDRVVALKVLPPAFLHDVTFARRFEREALVVAKLEHPNIVPIYARGIDEGVPWMSMRLLPGGTVGDRLRQGRPVPAHAVRWLRDVASALDHAHVQGVVHRDVKPTNILLDTAGQAYVADFGLAQMLDRASELTVGGALVGTPQYMAPEQALGSEVGPASDIYSLGIVAYELLTGSPPFIGDTPMAVMMKHVNEPLPSVSDGTCAPAVLNVVHRATAKRPEDRWPSAGAFVRALEHATSSSMSPSTAAALLPMSPHRRTVIAASLSAATLLTAAIGWFGTRPSNMELPVQSGAAGQNLEISSPRLQQPSPVVAAPGPAPLSTTAAAGSAAATQDAPTDAPATLIALPSATDRVPQDTLDERDLPPASAPVPELPAEPNPGPIPVAAAASTDIVIPSARLSSGISGDVVTPPVRRTTVVAEYPAAARAADLEGDVILDAGVGIDGRVTDVRVFKSVHPLLDESARRAVLRYSYRPGTRNGSPEAARVRVTVSFRLQ